MKILFLDIDGVLIPSIYANMLHKMWQISGGEIKSKDGNGAFFYDPCIAILKRIVGETDCRIVISSDWRKNGEIAMRGMWIDRQMPGGLIGITGVHDGQGRGYEIEKYLDYKMSTLNEPIQSYCVVDDLDVLGHGDNFVKINSKLGLTESDADKIIKILNDE